MTADNRAKPKLCVAPEPAPRFCITKRKSAFRAGVGPPLEKKAGHHVLSTGERPMNELHSQAARRPRLFVTSEENSS